MFHFFVLFTSVQCHFESNPNIIQLPYTKKSGNYARPGFDLNRNYNNERLQLYGKKKYNDSSSHTTFSV